MAIQTFDDFTDEDLYTAQQKPFEFRDDKNKKEATLQWLNANFDRQYEKADARFQVYRRHLNLYKNLKEDRGDGLIKTSNRDRGVTSKKPQIKVNKAFEYTEARVAQVSRQKVNVALIPRNDSEQEDINNAKACKIFLDARSEEINLDKLHRDADRTTFLYGTSFMEVCWDADAGPTSPAWEEAVAKYGEGKVPELDDSGRPIEGKYITEAPKIGDVVVKVRSPLDCYPGQGECWDDVKEFTVGEWMHVEEVKARWPKEAKKIEGVNTRPRYDLVQNMVSVPQDMLYIRTFWHKPTEFLPKGAKIVYCDEVILEEKDFPYADGKLPFVMDVDVEVPGELWGRSFLINIEQLIRMNNNIISGTARAHGVGSAPKWLIPEGSVDQKQLHNEYGNISFKGPVAPKLEFPQWVNRGEIDIQTALDTQMGRLSGVFEISKGEVPAGITAASAIRYLDEQEQQRASNTIAKRKSRVLDVYRLMISRMAQYYKESDGRSVKLLGKNNEYLIKSFKRMDFNQIYDVRLENVPLLSDTKSGRIADIIDLNAANQKDPLFGKEEMIQMLDLGLNDAFKRESTYGVDTARTILEMILLGEEVPPPEESDNLIAMLRIFYRHIESVSYKLKCPPQIKLKMTEYIAAIEMLASDKSQKNQKFAMELAMLSKFPVFFDTSDIQSEIAPAPLPQANPAAGLQSQGVDTQQMELTQEQIQQEMQQGE